MTSLMLMVIVVLFNHMGLREAVEKVLGYKFRILSCAKCGTFWLSLMFLVGNGTHLIASIMLSFVMAYIALWFELLLAVMAKCYESTYDKISETKADEADVSSHN